MKLDIQIDGVKEFTKYCGRIEADVEAKSRKYSLQAAQEIMKESLEEVPRETGALADSAFIEQEGTTVVFGYGGPNVQNNEKSKELTEEYMVAVHERLDVKHPVGKAKFLEDPVNNHSDSFFTKLSDQFLGWLGG